MKNTYNYKLLDTEINLRKSKWQLPAADKCYLIT